MVEEQSGGICTSLDSDLLADLGADGPDVDGAFAVVLDDSLADSGGGGDESRKSGDGETHGEVVNRRRG